MDSFPIIELMSNDWISATKIGTLLSLDWPRQALTPAPVTRNFGVFYECK